MSKKATPPNSSRAKRVRAHFKYARQHLGTFAAPGRFFTQSRAKCGCHVGAY